VEGILRVAWNAATQRFRDLATGRFVSAALAAPTLRAMARVPGEPSVVIRDALGRFVPHKFFGGPVLNQFITGAGQMVAVTRAIEDPVTDWLPRSWEYPSARVTVQTVTGEEVTAYVVMPKGVAFDEDIFEERLANRMTSVIGEGTGRYETVPMYGISKIEWSVTSYYKEGQFLGEDVARFGGIQGL